MAAEPTKTAHSILDMLRAHRDGLIDAGIVHLDIFGSAAQGEAEPRDIDICVELCEEKRPRGFARIGQFNDLRQMLRTLLGRPVDLVVYPVTRPRLREAIEREAVRAF